MAENKKETGVTNFLSPYEVPEITGDELDVDQALSSKPDLDVDNDTIVVNLSDPNAKPKVLGVTLPPQKPETPPSVEEPEQPAEEPKENTGDKGEENTGDAKADDKGADKAEKPEVNVNVTVNNNDKKEKKEKESPIKKLEQDTEETQSQEEETTDTEETTDNSTDTNDTADTNDNSSNDNTGTDTTDSNNADAKETETVQDSKQINSSNIIDETHNKYHGISSLLTGKEPTNENEEQSQNDTVTISNVKNLYNDKNKAPKPDDTLIVDLDAEASNSEQLVEKDSKDNDKDDDKDKVKDKDSTGKDDNKDNSDNEESNIKDLTGEDNSSKDDSNKDNDKDTETGVDNVDDNVDNSDITGSDDLTSNKNTTDETSTDPDESQPNPRIPAGGTNPTGQFSGNVDNSAENVDNSGNADEQGLWEPRPAGSNGENPEESGENVDNSEDDVDNSNLPVDNLAGVDHGENDLERDTNEPEPLLKLEAEYEFNATKVYRLANGVRVIYMNKPSELCLCEFEFGVGSYYEDDSNRGVSHLLEHLMFNGCPGQSALEFNAKMDKLGMKVNAFTNRTTTSFYFEGLKANFIPAFDLYENLLYSFTPTDEIVDKERGVVINEIGVYNDDNWSVLHESINSQAFRLHPVAHPILGYESVIEYITTDQVKEWYETNYVAPNLTIYIAGDFPEEDLVYIAEKMNGFRDGVKPNMPVITDAMCLPSYRNVIAYKEGITQTLIDSMMQVKFEGYNLYELQILSQVLGGTMSSVLWNAFREERSIAYQVGTYVSNLDADHLTLHMYAGLNSSDDAELAKQLFRDAAGHAKALGEDEFNKGLNIALAELLSDGETLEGIKNRVSEADYFGVTPDEFNLALKNLTYESYQNFAQQIIPDDLVTGILYPLVEE